MAEKWRHFSKQAFYRIGITLISEERYKNLVTQDSNYDVAL